MAYRIAYVAVVFIGPYLTVSVVWGVADVFNGLMAFPNLVALVLLSPVVWRTTEDFLRREIVMDDIHRLVEKPVRKISKFDTKAMEEKIASIEAEMDEVRNNIEHSTEYTIAWFKGLKAEYKKIIWPNKEEVRKETIAVVLISFVVGLVIAVLDMGLQYGIDFIINL